MRWAENGAVPVGHEQVVAFVEAVRACLYPVISASLSATFYVFRHIPAPRPFSPFSSSSSNRKLRGTLAPILEPFPCFRVVLWSANVQWW